jgi:sugar phosphate isomerase/epimerase
MVELKNRFPFRLGTTSYVIPGDLVENARWLAPRVDDMELVLFELDDVSNFPDPETVDTLKAIADEASFSYTVHFPGDIYLGAADESERTRSIQKCLSVYEMMQPLDPFAYVLHFHGDRRGEMPSEDIRRWRKHLDASIGQILDAGLPGHMICVETLDYPFGLVEDIVRDHGLSVCLDAGHLLMYGYPVDEYFARYFDRCRVVHLHGMQNGEDHHDISAIDAHHLALLFEWLRGVKADQCVVTLEMFDREELEMSLSTLAPYVT